MNLSEEELDLYLAKAHNPTDPIVVEELLSDFQPKFEKLLASFSEGDPDEVAADIERLHQTYVTFGGFSGLHVNVAFTDTFNEFLLAASRYLESTGRVNVLRKILEDFPEYFASFADTKGQLARIKINHFGPKHPIGPPRGEEFFPEID